MAEVEVSLSKKNRDTLATAAEKGFFVYKYQTKGKNVKVSFRPGSEMKVATRLLRAVPDIDADIREKLFDDLNLPPMSISMITRNVEHWINQELEDAEMEKPQS